MFSSPWLKKWANARRYLRNWEAFTSPAVPGEVGEWMFIVTEGTVKIVDQQLDIPWQHDQHGGMGVAFF